MTLSPTERIAVLRKALEDAMPVVSDRAAGGRMLTTVAEAETIWKRCNRALDATKETDGE